jgi:hypothetical protein|tara:strand:+ start:523 stop:936 length:414 start_codon:yes stop_codon:yes gene_type:complete
MINVLDLDGISRKWSLTGLSSHSKSNRKSELHLKTRSILKALYPTLQILEEVPIQVSKSSTLFMDFYLPLKKLCVEVHGEQHYKFIKHYHVNAIGFAKAKKRDQQKQDWCQINDIKYVALPYDEKEEEWTERIKNNE